MEIDLKDRIEKSIRECEHLIDKYDSNSDIDDIDICHVMEILRGRE